MPINKATAIKLKKQVSLAIAEGTNKRIVDEVLHLKLYTLECMVTGNTYGPMSFDEAMDRPDVYACKMMVKETN